MQRLLLHFGSFYTVTSSLAGFYGKHRLMLSVYAWNNKMKFPNLVFLKYAPLQKFIFLAFSPLLSKWGGGGTYNYEEHLYKFLANMVELFFFSTQRPKMTVQI